MILFFSTCNWTALLTYTRNGNIGGVFPSFKSDFVLLGFDARNMNFFNTISNLAAFYVCLWGGEEVEEVPWEGPATSPVECTTEALT